MAVQKDAEVAGAREAPQYYSPPGLRIPPSMHLHSHMDARMRPPGVAACPGNARATISVAHRISQNRRGNRRRMMVLLWRDTPAWKAAGRMGDGLQAYSPDIVRSNQTGTVRILPERASPCSPFLPRPATGLRAPARRQRSALHYRCRPVSIGAIGFGRNNLPEIHGNGAGVARGGDVPFYLISLTVIRFPFILIRRVNTASPSSLLPVT